MTMDTNPTIEIIDETELLAEYEDMIENGVTEDTFGDIEEMEEMLRENLVGTCEFLNSRENWDLSE